MIEPMGDRTPPMTPQLALRVAIVGTIALVLFAIVFFRLWFLQVLSGGQYVASARQNATRQVPAPGPRGQILAANGAVLVDSQPAPAVQIVPLDLPVPISLSTLENELLKHHGAQPRADYAVYDELAKLLNMSTTPRSCKFTLYLLKPHQESVRLAPIPCLVAQGIANAQYAPVTIKTDVPRDVSFYIQERQNQQQLEGVANNEVYLRRYPHGQLAAQVLGYVRPISQKELGEARRGGKTFAGAKPGDIVGQAGLELEYNQALRGTDGADVVKVNAANQFEGFGRSVPPQPGNNLQTSLDLRLEQAGSAALAHSIHVNASADSGAFVAMDPQNGQVYAMGSLPSYNPSDFVPTLSAKTWAQLNSKASDFPLINRAIDSPLPDGSTFKVITATAALESGVWQLGDIYDDDANFCLGAAFCLQNAGGVHYGPMDLQRAIEVSDDVFFYNLGAKMNVETGDGGALQKWAHLYGLGQTTGVDLPGEANGEIGSPKLQAELWKQERECDTATGIYAYTNGHGLVSATKKPGFYRSPKHPVTLSAQGDAIIGGSGCGIATASYWAPGDNVETGVGQYDDQLTPMQLAVVYAAVENGGTIVTPHIGEQVSSPTGTILQKIDPAPKRKLNIKPAYLAAIQQGLRLAASAPQGTSAGVMGNFPLPVYGKTGTAELGNSASSLEDAWYVCYVPASATRKPIVVAVNVERGGFGAVAAAPVARQILSQWFLGKMGPYIAGTSGDL